jgi:hypothetical protein
LHIPKICYLIRESESECCESGYLPCTPKISDGEEGRRGDERLRRRPRAEAATAGRGANQAAMNGSGNDQGVGSDHGPRRRPKNKAARARRRQGPKRRPRAELASNARRSTGAE